MMGKNRKCVGGDGVRGGVPQELLKVIVQSERGLASMSGFMNGVFSKRSPPEEWNTSQGPETYNEQQSCPQKLLQAGV